MLPALDACIAKQDDTAVKASMKEGEALGVGATPALFINGEKLEGAEPVEYVYRMIDNALVAAGQTPPPPSAASGYAGTARLRHRRRPSRAIRSRMQETKA